MTAKTEVRVRYAPSPTGFPHIGNIRTALFNWLLARHEGGRFILRIEDTDQARIVPGSLQAIMDGLRWLGLDWDEGPEAGGSFGPYIQSERLSIYQQYAEQLLEAGQAYRCYCTSERLDEMRAEQRARKEPPRYDRRCRYLSATERQALERAGLPWVVRFATPEEGTTTFVDYLRGEIAFEHAVLDDHVLLKSDGWPTYQLASVVDDHLMEISHVIRGDEWISSAPRHVLLYKAFGWDLPVLVHIPLILGKDHSKLSKRHGAVDVLQYREQGYLPEALVNFMALLGWALDEKTELFDRERLIREFTLDRLGKNPAIFDNDKLDWMNGHYIRQLAPAELAARLYPYYEQAGLVAKAGGESSARPIIDAITPYIQERMKRLTDAIELTDFLFTDVIQYQPALLVPKGWDAVQTATALQVALAEIEDADDMSAASLEARFRAKAEATGWKAGQFFGAIRVAVTGKTVAPPLFATIEALGRQRALARINHAVWLLTSPSV